MHQASLVDVGECQPTLEAMRCMWCCNAVCGTMMYYGHLWVKTVISCNIHMELVWRWFSLSDLSAHSELLLWRCGWPRFAVVLLICVRLPLIVLLAAASKRTNCRGSGTHGWGSCLVSARLKGDHSRLPWDSLGFAQHSDIQSLSCHQGWCYWLWFLPPRSAVVLGIRLSFHARLSKGDIRRTQYW